MFPLGSLPKLLTPILGTIANGMLSQVKLPARSDSRRLETLFADNLLGGVWPRGMRGMPSGTTSRQR